MKKNNFFTILVIVGALLITFVSVQSRKPTWNDIMLGRGYATGEYQPYTIPEPIDKFMLWFELKEGGYLNYSYEEFCKKLKQDYYRHYYYSILMSEQFLGVVDIDYIRGFDGLESIEFSSNGRPCNLTYNEFQKHLFNEMDFLQTTFNKDKVISLYQYLYYQVGRCSLQEFANKLKDNLYIDGIHKKLKKQLNRFAMPLTSKGLERNLMTNDWVKIWENK